MEHKTIGRTAIGGAVLMKNDARVQPQKPVPEAKKKAPPERRLWREPELRRREKLPRVTNGFASSFNP